MFESWANLFRNGRYSSLTIDGTQTEEGTSVGMFSILNVKGPVYIGKTVTIIQWWKNCIHFNFLNSGFLSELLE